VSPNPTDNLIYFAPVGYVFKPGKYISVYLNSILITDFTAKCDSANFAGELSYFYILDCTGTV
jgi:hypothetical protein